MAPNETISKQLSTDTPFDIRTGCTRIRPTPRPSRDLARIFPFHLSRTSNVCEIVEKKYIFRTWDIFETFRNYNVSKCWTNWCSKKFGNFSLKKLKKLEKSDKLSKILKLQNFKTTSPKTLTDNNSLINRLIKTSLWSAPRYLILVYIVSR